MIDRRAPVWILPLSLAAAGCGGSGASTAPAAASPAAAASPEKPPAGSVEASAPKPKGFSCLFDADAAGRLPAGFSFLTAGPISAAGVWKVEEVSGASSGRQVLSCVLKGSPEADRLGLSAETAPADGTVSARLRAGEAGAQGGIALRCQDASNYLVLLLDFDAGTATLARVENGARTVAAKGTFPPAEGWRTLAVACRGGSIKATLDGAELLSAREKGWTAGQTGLAARGTGKVLFDDFIVEVK